MDSFERFQVHGWMRKIPGTKEILLEIKPSTGTLEERLCSFCDEKSETHEKHFHALKGSFDFKENNLTFILAATSTEISKHSNPEDHRNHEHLDEEVSFVALSAEDEVSVSTVNETQIALHIINKKAGKKKSGVKVNKSSSKPLLKHQSTIQKVKKLSASNVQKKTFGLLIDSKSYSTITTKQNEENWQIDAQGIESYLKVLQVKAVYLQFVFQCNKIFFHKYSFSSRLH